MSKKILLVLLTVTLVVTAIMSLWPRSYMTVNPDFDKFSFGPSMYLRKTLGNGGQCQGVIENYEEVAKFSGRPFVSRHVLRYKCGGTGWDIIYPAAIALNFVSYAAVISGGWFIYKKLGRK